MTDQHLPEVTFFLRSKHEEVARSLEVERVALYFERCVWMGEDATLDEDDEARYPVVPAETEGAWGLPDSVDGTMKLSLHPDDAAGYEVGRFYLFMPLQRALNVDEQR